MIYPMNMHKDGKSAIIYLKIVLYRDAISVPQEERNVHAIYSHPPNISQCIIINPGHAIRNGTKSIMSSKIILFVPHTFIPTYAYAQIEIIKFAADII